MALLKEEKKQILNHFKTSELDTGSSEAQIALLTFNIQKLTEHFKIHRKDHHGRRGLIKMVNRRRKLLDYMKRKNLAGYTKIIGELGIRK